MSRPSTESGKKMLEDILKNHESEYGRMDRGERKRFRDSVGAEIVAIENEAREEGMQRQLERQLHYEWTPTRTVIVGPSNPMAPA